MREGNIVSLSLSLFIFTKGSQSESDFFFDLLPLEHRCSINTQAIGNNIDLTDWKRCRFRFHFNVHTP